MGLWTKIGKFIGKVFFGLDCSKQDKRIKKLESELRQIKSENERLKETIRIQNRLIVELNENLNKLLKNNNKSIEFHIYFSVIHKKGATIRNFELIIWGVCNSFVNAVEVTNVYENIVMVNYLLSLFDIHFSGNKITGIQVGGYSDTNSPNDTDTMLKTTLIIEEGGMKGDEIRFINNRWT